MEQVTPSPYIEAPDIPEGMTVPEYRRYRYVVEVEVNDHAHLRVRSLILRLLARRGLSVKSIERIDS